MNTTIAIEIGQDIIGRRNLWCYTQLFDFHLRYRYSVMSAFKQLTYSRIYPTRQAVN